MGSTIAAIATPLAPAGLGVIRISGPEAFCAVQRVFTSKSAKKLKEMNGYTCAYGVLRDEAGVIDECVAAVFRAPKSYTGEDVVELSCHGGVAIMERTLDALLANGASMAQPGEFTKRAFLNGKLDLTQAEAVMELIGAKTQRAAGIAAGRQEGALFREMQAIKEKIFSLSASLTAYLDYSEETGEEAQEDAETQIRTEFIQKTDQIITRLDKHLRSYGQGRLIRHGVSAVIAGKPNSGKSTLMNLLAGCEKSIVTALPGTTRDLIEETVSVDGILLNLTDTAGLRGTEETIEKIGVERSLKKIENAEFILAVFDGSKAIEPEDEKIMAMTRGKCRVAVVNKSDLPQKIDTKALEQEFGAVIKMTAQTGDGVDLLKKAIKNALNADGAEPGGEMIANARQLGCVKTAMRDLKQAKQDIEKGVSPDVVSVLIEASADAICEITGEKASEKIIDEIFSKFCVGK